MQLYPLGTSNPSISSAVPKFESTSKHRDLVSDDASLVCGDVFRGLRIGVRHDVDAKEVLRGGGKLIRCDASGKAVAGVPTHVVLEHGAVQDSERKGIPVTARWLTACVSANTLIPIKENRLYQPVQGKVRFPRDDTEIGMTARRRADLNTTVSISCLLRT